MIGIYQEMFYAQGLCSNDLNAPVLSLPTAVADNKYGKIHDLKSSKEFVGKVSYFRLDG